MPQYRALYDFQGQEGELNLAKDDVVELLEKEDNGTMEPWPHYNFC